MLERIIINPLTRISGFMEIDVKVENNIVVDAQTSGNLFRGFEKMLEGRNPFDAVYFTQRICGICSAAHSTASSIALEQALNITPTEQGRYLRDIVHGCEFLQNHIRHFYQYTLPDFIRLPQVSPLYDMEHSDYRLPDTVNNTIVEHYFKSLDFSRSAHELLAVLGGKAPHNHGIFLDGITTRPTTDKIIKMKSILSQIKNFINSVMIPDVKTIAHYYKDYFKLGVGHGNLLSYGCFYDYKALGTLYVKPSVYSGGLIKNFEASNITEKIDYSWYIGGKKDYRPYDQAPEADMNKEKAYTWVKAARYNDMPYEVGPLARLILSGDYTNGISMMDRTVARVLEAKKIADIIEILLDNVIPDIDLQKEYSIPENSSGQGLVDTTRGALGHWLKIDNKVLSFYQIITPTVWNLSSSDNIYKGTVEQALLGTVIKDIKKPVELGRIIRSFDPCVSCATHVYTPGREMQTITVIP